MKTQEILTYTNTKGESITFGVGSRYHVNVSKDVTGLSDLDDTIYSTSSMGQHGDTYTGVRIEPRPGGHFKQARASYRSVYGTVVSGWKKTDEGISFLVTVPANCEAEVVLPDGRAVRQTAGTREYAWKEQL